MSHESQTALPWLLPGAAQTCLEWVRAKLGMKKSLVTVVIARDLGGVYWPATFDDDGCHELGCNAKVGLRDIWPIVGQTKLTHHVNKETTLGFIWIAFVSCLC